MTRNALVGSTLVSAVKPCSCPASWNKERLWHRLGPPCTTSRDPQTLGKQDAE